ncbi:ATP-grasp fold subdomain 1 [Penicillium concentricum]|uniref:ATP-grasp fold subdomain 1 n=1 Tax=Penicillium concentricum TaxID=293559 RepID=A0A9W9UYT2_9EURO|nr:ATP-grasp fold subdomain 1 [Penicillium concentricum]KAJ5360175.1 ATP-grasp fold subdomain 1 [Penicillium concentricum]
MIPSEVTLQELTSAPYLGRGAAANILAQPLGSNQIIFIEVNDFPGAGDYENNENGAWVPRFVETSNRLPSALPPSELDSVQQRHHELALAAGFCNAMLHIEAKLRNSSWHYAMDSDAHGLDDLQLKTSTTTTTQPKDVFPIEINSCPPGWQEVEVTGRTHGASYYSLSLPNALGDK